MALYVKDDALLGIGCGSLLLVEGIQLLLKCLYEFDESLWRDDDLGNALCSHAFNVLNIFRSKHNRRPSFKERKI